MFVKNLGRTLRFLVIIFAFACVLMPTGPAQSAAALERGAAIIDPFALRELDRGPFALARIMQRSGSTDAALTNSALFALLVRAASVDPERCMMRARANGPRSSSRRAKGSMMAAPRSSAAALCAGPVGIKTQ